MDCHKFKIEDIEILLKKSKKAKRINIRIKPFDGVCMSVPHRMSFNKAKEFAKLHTDWILKNSKKIKEHEKNVITYDENTTFTTREHQLFIERVISNKSSSRVINGKILVKIPATENIKDTTNQKIIHNAIKRAYRKEAEKHLSKRLNELSNTHRLPYQDLRIKDLKSRWGSCSSLNNINLSLHLMKLPDELIDYVILHELAHTKHKNHSKNFWDYLETICPESKFLNKKLKFYKTAVH